MAGSPLCTRPPPQWDAIAAAMPAIVKKRESGGPTSRHFLREMASLRKQETVKLM
jgi:hypothetical protein